MRHLRLLPAVLATLGLSFFTACSSSSSGSAGSASLSGTAATGAPLVGLITAKDSLGQVRRTQTGADGKFTISTQGLTPPIMIEATPATGGTPLYSFSDSLTGITVNVTPLTSLALYLGSGNQELGSVFANWESRNSILNETRITDAQKIINKNLETEFRARGLDPTSFDFFNEAFDANQQGFDAVLDGIQIGIPRRTGEKPSFQIPSRPGFTFNDTIDVSDINLSPGAPGPNPGGGSGTETPATIPSHAAGTFAFIFSPNTASTQTSPYTSGQAVTFVVGTDGSLAFEGRTLTNPVLRNGNPAEAIWKDPARGLEFALSSIDRPTVPPHEINVSQDGTFATFLGQFNSGATKPTPTPTPTPGPTTIPTVVPTPTPTPTPTPPPTGQAAVLDAGASGRYTGTYAVEVATPGTEHPFSSGAAITVQLDATAATMSVRDTGRNVALAAPINRPAFVGFQTSIAIFTDSSVDPATEYRLSDPSSPNGVQKIEVFVDSQKIAQIVLQKAFSVNTGLSGTYTGQYARVSTRPEIPWSQLEPLTVVFDANAQTLSVGNPAKTFQLSNPTPTAPVGTVTNFTRFQFTDATTGFTFTVGNLTHQNLTFLEVKDGGSFLGTVQLTTGS